MMRDATLELEKRRHIAIRDKLIADDPELDERTLADTVEGCTNFVDVIAAITRAAIEDETMMALLRVRISEMQDRLHRFADRAERRRNIVRDAMLDADLQKFTLPEMTVSVRRSTPHVVVIDEKLIPADFVELRPVLKKRELLNALNDGVAIPGAVLSNPIMSLSVRTR